MRLIKSRRITVIIQYKEKIYFFHVLCQTPSKVTLCIAETKKKKLPHLQEFNLFAQIKRESVIIGCLKIDFSLRCMFYFVLYRHIYNIKKTSTSYILINNVFLITVTQAKRL